MTYGEIRTQFLTILNRTDCSDALADIFIAQGIARAQRTLKLPAQETLLSTTIATDGDAVTLPADLLRIIAVYRDADTGIQLQRIGLPKYLDMQPDGTSETPLYWTRDRGTLLVSPGPTAGTIIKVLYHAEFGAFADDDDETTMSTVAPDLFIYGGLSYAADNFLDARLQRYESRFVQIMQELQDQANDDELAGGAIISPAYVFPDDCI
jgi:hypothetical protein